MQSPGLGYGSYFRLLDIVEKGTLATAKALFEFRDRVVYFDGKPLQGLRVVVDNVPLALITGVHYSSWEMATQMRSRNAIEPSLDDPFVYISEPGKMAGWPEEAIRKELGARHADAEVRLTLVVPVTRVWIKASRNVVHYAISGIVGKAEIKNLEVVKRKAV